MVNLDLKDRKILYELDANCRQSASEIGKKVGLSPEVTNYRIKRLESDNIITHYQLIANLSALGIYQFKLCISIQHTTTDDLDKIITKLKDNARIKWIVQTKGNWDLLIAFEVDDFNMINTLKNETLATFGNRVRDKALSVLVEADTYNRNYLLDDAPSTERLIMKKSQPIRLDDLDMSILHSLAKNARKPLIEIASEVGESSRTVHYRMKQLQKKKIILGYKVAIDYSLLDIQFYKTFIYLSGPKIDSVKRLKATLENNPNVTHNVEVLSNWDLEPEFEVSDEAEFDSILRSLRDDFKDLISRIDILTITKEHKFEYF